MRKRDSRVVVHPLADPAVHEAVGRKLIADRDAELAIACLVMVTALLAVLDWTGSINPLAVCPGFLVCLVVSLVMRRWSRQLPPTISFACMTGQAIVLGDEVREYYDRAEAEIASRPSSDDARLTCRIQLFDYASLMNTVSPNSEELRELMRTMDGLIDQYLPRPTA